MNQKFRYFGPHDRVEVEIESLHNQGAAAAVIADKTSVHTATIYCELPMRGTRAAGIPPGGIRAISGYDTTQTAITKYHFGEGNAMP